MNTQWRQCGFPRQDGVSPLGKGQGVYKEALWIPQFELLEGTGQGRQ